MDVTCHKCQRSVSAFTVNRLLITVNGRDVYRAELCDQDAQRLVDHLGEFMRELEARAPEP